MKDALSETRGSTDEPERTMSGSDHEKDRRTRVPAKENVHEVFTML